MLVIRMQRTGRKGHAQFRVVVQDSRRTPTSGKIVAQLGHYNPHSKETLLNKEKAQFYLEHGAQPSDRAARLLKSEGVKLPKWVTIDDKKAGKLKNPDKLRRNRPAEEAAPAAAEPVEGSAEPAIAEVTPATEQPAETTKNQAETPAAEATAEEPQAEASVDEITTEPETPSEPEAKTEAEPDKPTDSGGSA